MTQETYTLGSTPTIVINTCSGDLEITGQTLEMETATIIGDASRHTVQIGSQLMIERCDDLRLTAPRGATIVVQRVDGDARIEYLAGAQIGEIGGDLNARFIEQDCSAGRVGGDVRAIDIANLALGPVGGDVRLEGLTGALRLARVDGDATVCGAVDGFGPAQVGGDLTLDIRFTPGHEYRLDVGGDATVLLPADAGLTLRATAGGDVSGVAMNGNGSAEGKWGDGAAQLTLHAGGDLVARTSNTESERSSSTSTSDIEAATSVAPPASSQAGAAGDTLAVLEAVARGDLSAAEADDLLSRVAHQ